MCPPLVSRGYEQAVAKPGFEETVLTAFVNMHRAAKNYLQHTNRVCNVYRQRASHIVTIDRVEIYQ